MKKAFQRSRQILGDDATLLFDGDLSYSMIEICKSHGKEMGGPWECYDAANFYGWEAEKVVAVTTGWNILEKATRAKTELILIIAELDKEEAKKCPGRRRRQSVYYKNIQEKIEEASDVGLVDMEVIESRNN